MKYHVNGKGEAGKCSADKGNCPFGGEENHYPSKENAQKAFELSNAGQTLAPVSKKPAIAPPRKKKSPIMGDDVILKSSSIMGGGEGAEFGGRQGKVVNFTGTYYHIEFPDGTSTRAHWQHVDFAPEGKSAQPLPGMGRVQYFDTSWNGWRDIDTYGDALRSDFLLVDAKKVALEKSQGNTKMRVLAFDEDGTENITTYSHGKAKSIPKASKKPTSPDVHKVGNRLMVKPEVEEKVNKYPSCFSAEADRALRNQVAKMYEFAATRKLTPDEFFVAAEDQFYKLEGKYIDDGITDTEPRCYWKDHMDNICDIQGWKRQYS